MALSFLICSSHLSTSFKFFAMQKSNSIQNGIGSGQMLSFDSSTCPTACKSVGIIIFHHLFAEPDEAIMGFYNMRNFIELAI